MKVQDLLSSEQCNEIIESRQEWVFGPVPYHEACMRRAAIIAVRAFAERMAERFEHAEFTRHEAAEALRSAARELEGGEP
jgi:hypothetical protein